MSGVPSVGCESIGDIRGELSDKTSEFPYATWKIPKCSYIYQFCRSPDIGFADASWCFRLNPDFYSTDSGRVFRIGLVRLCSSVPKHNVFVTIALKTILGELLLCSSEYCFQGNPPNVVNLVDASQEEFDKRKDLFLPNNELILCWDMRITASDSVNILQTEVIEQQTRLASMEQLVFDYKKLLQSGVGSDVCLVVSGTVFRAHKWILKTRSSVFCAMFDHEMLEKYSGKVVIDGLDPDSFGTFLEYVYTGRVEALSDGNAFHLYVAADKYDLQTLKSECLVYMRRSLSVSSFCDVMMLSMTYKEEELMDLAIDFFKKNMSQIVLTVKWQVFVSENGAKANELLIKSFESRQR